MIVAAKAQWVVLTGLWPGNVDEADCKAWHYNSDHYERDGNRRGEIYAQLEAAANDYAAGLRRAGANWVSLEYIWF
jgi:hypothetical protein